jgi:N-acetylglucosamine-6-phosphate deacetylase
MARVLLDNALIIDPEGDSPAPGALLLDGERIAGRLPPTGSRPEDVERRDLGGAGLCPGFLDLHYHGGLVFAEPDDALQGLRHEATGLLRHGVTGFLPTTVAWPREALAKRVDAWVDALANAGGEGAEPLGIHLEGPWIRGDAAGAQPREGIRRFEAAEGAELLARGSGAIRMVTLAPEVEGAAALQEALGRHGIVAALGHSLADEADVRAAVERGARHVTHLFNAMGVLHHRRPGLVGAALTDERLACDLICDGVHVHPAVVRLAARAKGDGLILITDRVAPPEAGRAGAEHAFGAGPVHDDGTALRLADGTLAGSRLAMDRALQNAEAFGAMTRTEAVAACTLRPARLLGLESRRGTLRVGARADLAVLGPDGAVRETWLGGRRVYAAS